MSVIAKALKKSREKDSKSLFLINHLQFRRSYNIPFYLIILILLIVVIYIFLELFYFKRNFYSYPQINPDNYEAKYKDTIKGFENSMKGKNIREIDLKYSIKSGDFNKVNNFLSEIRPLNDKLYSKYIALLFYHQKNYPKAEIYFSDFISKFGYDDEVIAALGNISFYKKDIQQALKYYEQLKKDSFEVNLNKAIIYETLGDLKKANLFYHSAYQNVNDPLYKKRIYNKIFLLKNYE